ncbi:MAG: hypothetical protein Q8M98_02775 [Candidatus Cloacimonadaceae bacterium]|nr:hypothetical protein [Candidatus Cloacimonadaceae bacterium]
MYRFGISYYIMSAANRIPLTGVTIRLVRPGRTFIEGIKVTEATSGSGYYETDTLLERDWGFYEIWDNKVDPNGSFSGKTCTVGKLDARGIQNSAIYTNHVLNESITADKLSDDCIERRHLKNETIPLSKLIYEIQDQNNGVGAPSQRTPPDINHDQSVSHKLDREYDTLPQVILTNQCDCFLYITDVKLDGRQVTVTIGISQRWTAPELRYSILALSSD